jgi:hypothetical protein
MAETALLREGRSRLERAMLAGGGWGYRPAGQLFVEPTALALIALAPRHPSPHPSSEDVIARSVGALVSCQREGGFFGAAPEDPDPSWATAPALMALTAHGVSDRTTAAGEWLVNCKAPQGTPSGEFRETVKRMVHIDVTVRGWPSEGGDAFATVEPSSLACLALRAWDARAGAERIAEGLRYLADRECAAGGWNYGNPYFLDDEMPPIARPTAVGLLALLLCGQSPDTPLVRRSIAVLSRLLEHNPSRKAHAWCALVFAAAGDEARASEHARTAVDTEDGRGPWGGGPDATALSIVALRAISGDAPICLSVSGT